MIYCTKQSLTRQDTMYVLYYLPVEYTKRYYGVQSLKPKLAITHNVNPNASH